MLVLEHFPVYHEKGGNSVKPIFTERLSKISSILGGHRMVKRDGLCLQDWPGVQTEENEVKGWMPS